MHRPQWWDDAQSENISKAYQTATAWKDIDPEAASAEQRIVEEVSTRFGVDLTRDSGPNGVTDALAREEQAGANAQGERGAARVETAQAVRLMVGVDAIDQQAEAAAGETAPENEAWYDTDDPFFMESNPFSEPADYYDDWQAAEERAMAEPDTQAGDELRKNGHAAYGSAERRQELATSLDHIGKPGRGRRAGTRRRVASTTSHRRHDQYARPGAEGARDPRQHPAHPDGAANRAQPIANPHKIQRRRGLDAADQDRAFGFETLPDNREARSRLSGLKEAKVRASEGRQTCRGSTARRCRYYPSPGDLDPRPRDRRDDPPAAPRLAKSLKLTTSTPN